MNIRTIENRDIEKYKNKLLSNYILFNKQNENIYKEFRELSLIFRQREKGNIKIISDNDVDIMLVWYDYRNYGAHIRSLVPLFNLDDYRKMNYKRISNLLRNNSSYEKDKYLYEYITYDNEINNYALKELGFIKVSKLIEMEINLEDYKIKNKKSSKDNFPSEFRDTRLEKMTLELISERVKIQNKIFHAKDRSPVSRIDIFLDINSRNYIKDLSYFYKKGNKRIGYFQIGRYNSSYYLFNFGIVPKYRNKGYALDFLNNILFISKEYGINILKLTVDEVNKKATNLYEKFGFKKTSSTTTWHYSVKK